MTIRSAGPSLAVLVILAAFVGMACRQESNADAASGRSQPGAHDPWSSAQTVGAAELAKEVAASAGGNRPAVVFVGFRSLYRGGHVPGSVFLGPAVSAEGMASLRRWAGSVPKSIDVVLYCGCCPLDECPNVRPAFAALRDMGFTHLRVLVLPNSYAADWLDKGYPVER